MLASLFLCRSTTLRQQPLRPQVKRDPLGRSGSMSTPRTLSSAQTFLTKIIFPLIWIGGFALATASLFLAPGSWQGNSGVPPDPNLKWLFLGITLVGGLLISWSCIRLKRVRMDDHMLYVSNYATEIAVPLANVARISENRWLRDHPVTVEFYAQTEFGARIVFMPKTRWQWWKSWSPHPVVQEIRTAVARATGKLPGDAAA